MNDFLDFAFTIGNTTIHVAAGYLAETSADVLVSSDDIYLTMSGGVSQSLRRAGGEALGNDVRKQSLPLQAGQVVVTTAGSLPARYVFHAITTDFRAKPVADVLIARLMLRIFELGSAMQVRHVAMPLIATGTVKLPAEEVLYDILLSAAYQAAARATTITDLTVVVLESHAAAARQAIARIQPKIKDAAGAQAQVQRFGQWLAAVDDDMELSTLLQSRIAAAAVKLRELFYFAGLDSARKLADPDSTSASTRKAARERLQKVVSDLQAEVETRLKALNEARLFLLALQDQAGLSSGVEKARVDVAVFAAERNVKALEQEVDQARKNLEALEGQLRGL